MFGPVVLFLSGPVSAVTFFSFFKCILIFVCVYFVWWIWCFKSLLFLRSISWGKDCNAMFLFLGSSLYFLFLSLLHFTETYTDGCLFWLSAYVLGVTLYSGWSLYILMVTTCSSGHFWHIFFIVVTRWHFVTAVFQWLPHFVVVVHFGSTGGCYGRHGVTWSQLLSVSLFLACVHECVDHETLFKGSLPQVWQLQDIDFVAGAARCSTWPQVVMVGVLTVVKALRSVHNRCFCGGQIALKVFVMGVWMVVRPHWRCLWWVSWWWSDNTEGVYERCLVRSHWGCLWKVSGQWSDDAEGVYERCLDAVQITLKVFRTGVWMVFRSHYRCLGKVSDNGWITLKVFMKSIWTMVRWEWRWSLLQC